MRGFVVSALCLAAMVSLAMCDAVTADEPPAVPAKSEVLVWLEKAEAAANKITGAMDESGRYEARDWALTMVAGTCIELGEYDKAKAIAATLPDERRKSLLNLVSWSLARAGRVDDAVREAEKLGSAEGWRHLISGLVGHGDLARAIQLIEKVPETSRDDLHVSIVSKQVIAGDLAAAERTAARIKADEPPSEAEADEFEDVGPKATAESWLAAGRLVWGYEKAQKAGAQAKTDPEMVEAALRDIARGRVEAGDMKKAETILARLTTPDDRARVFIAMADWHLGRHEMDEFDRCLGAASREVASIGQSDLRSLQQAGMRMEIARLQVRAGRLDEAKKTIALADKNGQEETKKWQELGVKSGGIFNAMGGRKALIGLLLQAGKLDDAVKMATAEDGTLQPEFVSMFVEAYAAAGATTRVTEIVKSAKSPNEEYTLCLSAARGAAKKARGR